MDRPKRNAKEFCCYKIGIMRSKACCSFEVLQAGVTLALAQMVSALFVRYSINFRRISVSLSALHEKKVSSIMDTTIMVLKSVAI
jgi:hypothetical protein